MENENAEIYKAKRKPAEAAKKQHARCWNDPWGCGVLCEITRLAGPVVVSAKNYNPAMKLCLDCSNRLAGQWNLAFEDLPFLATAWGVARVGKMGEDGSREDVLACLRVMGFKDRPGHRMQCTDMGVKLSDVQARMAGIAQRMAA